MRVLAIDPGTTQSAYVVFEDGEIKAKNIVPNEEMLRVINVYQSGCEVAIEMIQSYGMPVGREIFETCLWVGRFYQVLANYGSVPSLYSRVKVKSYVTGSARAKDKDVRQAMMVRFGGTKKGEPLHGVSKDIWSALAVAVYHTDGAVLGGWKD